MDKARSEPHPARTGDPGDTVAALYGVLWETLADVLGPATTATLLARSAKYASAKQPSLTLITIARESFDYRYTLPKTWDSHAPDAMAALRALIDELRRLLIPLTGDVVVRRFERISAFQRCGLVPLPKDTP